MEIEAKLQQHGISIDEVVTFINTQGGRAVHKPIIVKEKCQKCGSLFFSNTQDHNMRIAGGHATNCPSCRELERRDVRRQNSQNYRRKKGRK